MVLTATYVATAILLAPLIFVAAEWVGHDRSPRPPHRVMYSVLAGALWPLLVVGAAQFAVIVAVRHVLMPRTSGPANPDRLSGDADTTRLPRLTVPYARVGTSAS